MKKYSRTWEYTFEYENEDIEGDIYPFIVEFFAEKYNIDNTTADKIINGEDLEEQIFYDNEDIILDEAREYYKPYDNEPDYYHQWLDGQLEER